MAARIVVVFALAAALMGHAQATSWNVGSRMAAIESLVDRGTFAIDASPFSTGDKYRYDGHFYSDKPPLPSVLGAAVAAVLHTFGVDVVRGARVVMYATTVVTVAIPFGFAIGALYALVRRLGADERWALAVATLGGSATLAYPYATVLINHVPAAACLLAALDAIVRGRRDDRRLPLLAAGALLAVAVAIDTSFVIFLALAPLAIGRAPARAYGAVVVGAFPVLAARGLADVALSGDLRPPDTNAALFDYPGSEFAHGYIVGSLGARSARELAIYAFNIVAGTRGLFTYSPVLVFGVIALVRTLRSRACATDRGTYAFVAVASVAYVASVVVGTSDYGGDAYGMRRLVGVGLLLCIPLGAIGDDLRHAGWPRATFLIVAATSIVAALAGTVDTFSTRPFPLGDALPAFIRYARANHVHATLNLAFLTCFGVAAYLAVRGALVPARRHGSGAARERSPRASSRASKRW